MLYINLRQLEYFVAAARHGGAARAAEAVNVSQPSISKAIADLEALWGETLFVRRHARGLDLTAAGAVRSREAAALLDGARALQGPRSAGVAGVLRLGFLSTLGARWVPEILSQMRRSHPRIVLELVEGDIDSLTRQVERGELDAALQYDTGLARPRIDTLAVAALAPYVLLAHRHPLAASASVSLAEVAAHPLVLINLPHSREYFLSLFREAGVTPTVAYEFASIEMLRSMVANGHGLSVLTTRPAVDRTHDGQRLVCRRIRGRVAPQSVVLAVPRGNASPLVAPFVEAARRVIAP